MSVPDAKAIWCDVAVTSKLWSAVGRRLECNETRHRFKMRPPRTSLFKSAVALLCRPSGLRTPNRAGFSMLEIIVVLLLVGIVGALSLPLFSKVMMATVSGAADQQTAEEAYWAAARMTSIFGQAANQVDSSDSTTVTAQSEDGDQTFSFNKDTNQITLNDVLFLDQVHYFKASYTKPLFKIEIQLVDGKHPINSIDVFARGAK